MEYAEPCHSPGPVSLGRRLLDGSAVETTGQVCNITWKEALGAYQQANGEKKTLVPRVAFPPVSRS